MKPFLYVLAMFIGIAIGGMMATYILFGLMTLGGIVFLIESVPWLKWIVYRMNSTIDIIIFVLTIIATIKLGVTIAGSLTIAGLGFTMIYRPYINYVKSKTK
jgi:hypothetical protein